jgi:hypothetical protein
MGMGKLVRSGPRAHKMRTFRIPEKLDEPRTLVGYHLHHFGAGLFERDHTADSLRLLGLPNSVTTKSGGFL